MFEFVNYDDDEYVLTNEHVRDGLTLDGIVWSFTSLQEGRFANWHPVTWISHMLDCQLFGLDAGAHHLVNATIHALNATLVFVMLQSMTGAPWRSAFVAALFALHPLRVESVAWIAERKDVLSGFFFLSTIIAYGRFATSRSWGLYWLSLALFALGLLTKPMLVTLPAILMLLDAWPLGRLGVGAAASPAARDARGWLDRLKEKVPFFVLAGLSCVVTIWVQRRGGSLSTLDNVPVGFRVANALVAYVGYLKSNVWPAGLALLYPLTVIPLWQSLGAFLILVALSGLVVWQRERRPYLLVGWLWFLLMLAPVIGLLRVGVQSMADRYTYLPALGLYVALTWLVSDISAAYRHRVAVLGVVAGAVIASSVALTSFQLQFWRNSVSLWERTIAVTAPNATAQYNLALAYEAAGRPQDAIDHFREALRIRPDFYEAATNLGVALAARGEYAGAFAAYAEALRINPTHVQAHFNWAAGLVQEGRFAEAIAHYSEVVRVMPAHVEARTNLGAALARVGRVPEAIHEYREVLKIRPDFADAHYNLANVLLRSDQTSEAIAEYAEAVRLQPDDGEFHYALAVALVNEARTTEALDHLRRAVELQPQLDGARRLLAELSRSGRS